MADESGNGDLTGLPLGREVSYGDQYDASLLCPIQRRQSRESLGIGAGRLPFYGEDIWNAFELSWLDRRGKPVVARAELRFPADTPAIVESKSLKLYLNSFNQTRFDDRRSVEETLTRDLSAAAGGAAQVVITDLAQEQMGSPEGQCLDDLAIEIRDYQLAPDSLQSAGDIVEEQLYSHLLRSLCPVTGQPDWATVVISYRGQAINREGLLRYIVSYRQHQEFHEQCVERMYCDIHARCQPETLLVYARYLRRGGLDINPYRCSEEGDFPNIRLSRQ